MRTLLTFLFCVTGISVTISQEITSEDSVKAARAYANIRPLLSNKTIETYLPNLVNLVEVDDFGNEYKLGVDGTRRLLFAISCAEADGKPDVVVNGQYGFLQIMKIMQDDYYQNNSQAKRVALADLAKRENMIEGLKILNWYAGHRSYKLTSIERIVRGWRGGPDGWREYGTPGEDVAHHERELQKTWDYYQRVLKYMKLYGYFENSGIAQVLWDSPP